MITSIITSQEIEKHLELDELVKGDINEVKNYSLRISSGGVYTSYIVKLLQGEPFILGFAGGLGGRHIKNYLDKNRIKSSLLYKEDEIFAKFIISSNQETTILIDKNIAYDENDLKNLKHKISSSLEKTSVYTLNASAKNKSEKEVLDLTLNFLKEKNKAHIFSLKDGYVDEFLSTKPIAIIANISQFKILEGVNSFDKKLDALRESIKINKIKYLLLIDGNTHYFISKNKILSLSSPELVDADISAMLGALAIGIKRKYEFEKTMKLISATATSFDYKAFPELLNRKALDDASAKISLKTIYDNGEFTEDV